MKLEYTEGCTAYSMNIDGIESCDMDIKDFRNIVELLVKREADISILQRCYEYLLTSQGEYEDLGKCDCCGENVTRYTLEI